ncbi:MAG: hypothetical protein WA532_09830 [Candidatus Korobacteraceae bacterium]
MNFSGWVPIRRGLIEHLQDGRLTLMEFSVLVGLILLASKDTGSGTINANTLAAFMGEGLDYESDVLRNRQRGKQRVLRNLESKHYIFRRIVPHSKRAYRYWVNKYQITDGPYKSRRLDLAQVFESKDIADISYVGCVAEPVVESVAHTVVESVAHTVTSNKKDKETDTQKGNTQGVLGLSASRNGSMNQAMSAATKPAMGEGVCASLNASQKPSALAALSASLKPACISDTSPTRDRQAEAERLSSQITSQLNLTRPNDKASWHTAVQELLEKHSPRTVQTVAEHMVELAPMAMLRAGAAGFVEQFPAILQALQPKPQPVEMAS